MQNARCKMRKNQSGSGLFIVALHLPSTVWRSALLGAVLCAAIVALPGETMVRAHEIGTTRVSVVFHEGRTYDVEIVTDAAALAEKLDASAGQPPVRGRGAEVLKS